MSILKNPRKKESKKCNEKGRETELLTLKIKELDEKRKLLKMKTLQEDEDIHTKIEMLQKHKSNQNN